MIERTKQKRRELRQSVIMPSFQKMVHTNMRTVALVQAPKSRETTTLLAFPLAMMSL